MSLPVSGLRVSPPPRAQQSPTEHRCIHTAVIAPRCVCGSLWPLEFRMVNGALVFPGAGGINRAGAAVPTFLRTPTMIQPHLDMKSFLQFPMETPPPPHSMSLFHNFNTVRTNSLLMLSLPLTGPLPSLKQIKQQFGDHFYSRALQTQRSV